MLFKGLIRKTPLHFSLVCLLELVRFFKVSFIIGSQAAFFSATSMFAPMIGALGGRRYALNIYLIQLIKGFLISGNLFLYIGYHIPHLFASAYWLESSKFHRLIVPVICMVLFLLHPIGFQAGLYSSLWFIPVVISFFGHEHIFFRALGSTFVAHSVGSVIWLYTLAMPAEAWLALIPIALMERLVFACGMTIIYYTYSFGKSYLNKISYAPLGNFRRNYING